MGFEPIGTLDYLAGDVPASEPPQEASGGIQFTALDWDQANGFKQFADVVQRTYDDTLDCPELAAYRTAPQTLNGYRSSPAFDPELWFLATDSNDQPIGCLVLANHQPAAGEYPDGEAAPVIEIVYMGLVPEARGNGDGVRLVQHAMLSAREMGAERIILAVDQRNKPARAIYTAAGLQPMLSETVWVKLLN